MRRATWSPRFKATNEGWVELESGVPWGTIRALKNLEHALGIGSGGFGGYQGILRDHENGTDQGSSESRKDGPTVAY